MKNMISPGKRFAFSLTVIAVLAASSLIIAAAQSRGATAVYTTQQAAAGRSLRVSGAVLGETIQYDTRTLTITFEMAHISNDAADIEAAGGLAQALHNATLDADLPRMTVVYVGPKPDLLKNEAQAIVTGKLGTDGIFYADELLLKCPTRYDEVVPGQAEG